LKVINVFPLEMLNDEDTSDGKIIFDFERFICAAGAFHFERDIRID
jgi:hypothetical protein